MHAFSSLIAAPATAAFVMPANARIRFVSRAGSVAGATAATLTGASVRTIKTPLLAVGGHVVIDYVERAVLVAPSSGFNVELDIGLSVWRQIASIA